MTEGRHDVTEPATAIDRSRVVAGRYEILERVGAGAMGQVLHVRHLRLGKEFALKLMQPEMVADARAHALFVTEAQLASKLSHPNIVSVVDFGDDPDWGLFIAMELLVGEPLSARIERDGRLPVDVACHVARQLAQALDHSHQHGVVHGDLKADNVLCRADGDADWHVVLLDFGTARLSSTRRGRDVEIDATPAYVAPERLVGEPPRAANDLYALGVLLYEMLTGSTPFAGRALDAVLEAHLHETPEPVGARRGEVLDDALVAIVDRCLAKDPARRHPSAGALADELGAYLHATGARDLALAQRAGLTACSREEAATDAFDQLEVACAGLDVDGTIRVANRAFRRVLGGDEPVAGVNVCDTALGQLHPGLREDLRLAAMRGETIRGQLLVPDGDGGDEVMRLTLSPSQGRCGPCLLVLHALVAAPPR
ncbi:MAG: protein kinase [Kofleriaceae bacterium]|nr:protein kinase [Myxococcales bacterium]MCB9562231.1 protein kinase [Kofleriaceae bacterium]